MIISLMLSRVFKSTTYILGASRMSFLLCLDFVIQKKGGHLGPPHGFMILFFYAKKLIVLGFR